MFAIFAPRAIALTITLCVCMALGIASVIYPFETEWNNPLFLAFCFSGCSLFTVWVFLGLCSPNYFSDRLSKKAEQITLIDQMTDVLSKRVEGLQNQLNTVSLSLGSLDDQSQHRLHLIEQASSRIVLLSEEMSSKALLNAELMNERVQHYQKISQHVDDKISIHLNSLSEKETSIAQSLDKTLSHVHDVMYATTSKADELFDKISDRSALVRDEIERTVDVLENAVHHLSDGSHRVAETFGVVVQNLDQSSDRVFQTIEGLNSLSCEKTFRDVTKTANMLEDAAGRVSVLMNPFKVLLDQLNQGTRSLMDNAESMMDKTQMLGHSLEETLTRLEASTSAVERKIVSLTPFIDSASSRISSQAEIIQQTSFQTKETVRQTFDEINQMSNNFFEKSKNIADSMLQNMHDLISQSKGAEDVAQQSLKSLDFAVHSFKATRSDMRDLLEEISKSAQHAEDSNRTLRANALQDLDAFFGEFSDKYSECEKTLSKTQALLQSVEHIANVTLTTIKPAEQSLMEHSQQFQDQAQNLNASIGTMLQRFETGIGSLKAASVTSFDALKESFDRIDAVHLWLKEKLPSFSKPISDVGSLLEVVQEGLDKMLHTSEILGHQLMTVNQASFEAGGKFQEVVLSAHEAVITLQRQFENSKQQLQEFQQDFAQHIHQTQVSVQSAKETIVDFATQAVEKTNVVSQQASENISRMTTVAAAQAISAVDHSERELNRLAQTTKNVTQEAVNIIHGVVDEIHDHAKSSLASIEDATRQHASSIVQSGIDQISMMESSTNVLGQNIQKITQDLHSIEESVIENLRQGVDEAEKFMLLTTSHKEEKEILQRLEEGLVSLKKDLSDFSLKTEDDISRLVDVGKEQAERMMSVSYEVERLLQGNEDGRGVEVQQIPTQSHLTEVADKAVQRVVLAAEAKIRDIGAVVPVEQNILRGDFMKQNADLYAELNAASIDLAILLSDEDDSRRAFQKLFSGKPETHRRLIVTLSLDDVLMETLISYRQKCLQFIEQAKKVDPSLETTFSNTDMIKLAEFIGKLKDFVSKK